MTQVIPKPENLARLVLFIRGEKVLLDTDLADLYGIEARVLNQSVARNRARFPDDFMFQLTTEEWTAMRSQIVTASGAKGRKSSQTVMSSRPVAGLTSQIVMSNGRGGRHSLSTTHSPEHHGHQNHHQARRNPLTESKAID